MRKQYQLRTHSVPCLHWRGDRYGRHTGHGHAVQLVQNNRICAGRFCTTQLCTHSLSRAYIGEATDMVNTQDTDTRCNWSRTTGSALVASVWPVPSYKDLHYKKSETKEKKGSALVTKRYFLISYFRCALTMATNLVRLPTSKQSTTLILVQNDRNGTGHVSLCVGHVLPSVCLWSPPHCQLLCQLSRSCTPRFVHYWSCHYFHELLCRK